MIEIATRPASARISGTLHLKKRTAAPAGSAEAKVDLTNASVHDQAVMPHERDEKVGMTGGISSPLVQQAARDLEHGIQDTSKSVESDLAYARLKHP